MTEPKYIITDELLNELYEHCDWGMTNWMKFKDKLHPYNPQAEREKVLDEGIAQIQKRINGIFDAYRGETNERLTERPYNMANGMGESILILKELRQGGE